jgi:hypothetical protein
MNVTWPAGILAQAAPFFMLVVLAIVVVRNDLTVREEAHTDLEHRLLKIEGELAAYRRLMRSPTDTESGEDSGMLSNTMDMPADSEEVGKHSFCRGHSAMFMGGFQSKLDRKHPCLVLLTSGFVLNSTGKHVIAAVFVFFAGVANAVVSWVRRRVLLSTRAAGRKGQLGRFFWYTFELSVSYLLMLSVMSYWIWFFFAAVAGQAVGHLLLLDEEEVNRAALGESDRTPSAASRQNSAGLDSDRSTI